MTDSWIEISDELPTDGQDVIYFFEYVGVHRGKFTQDEYDPEHFGVDDNGNPYKGNVFYSDRGFLTDDVTHWMPDEGQPLPDKPIMIFEITNEDNIPAPLLRAIENNEVIECEGAPGIWVALDDPDFRCGVKYRVQES